MKIPQVQTHDEALKKRGLVRCADDLWFVTDREVYFFTILTDQVGDGVSVPHWQFLEFLDRMD